MSVVAWLIPLSAFTIFLIWYINLLEDLIHTSTRFERIRRRRITGKRLQITRRY